MIPESVFIILHVCYIVFLTQETVAKEGQHPSNPNHLSCDLLHIVSKQNVHSLGLEGFEMCTDHCHVQLYVAVHMDTGRNLVLDCRRADVTVSFGRRKEVLETFEPGGEEADEETSGLVETIEIMDHHVQIESKGKHLTCKRVASKDPVTVTEVQIAK